MLILNTTVEENGVVIGASISEKTDLGFSHTTVSTQFGAKNKKPPVSGGCMGGNTFLLRKNKKERNIPV